MKQEIKDLWVKALRSGEYLQGFGSLRIQTEVGPPCYCPLGVLCDLYVKAHRTQWAYYKYDNGDKAKHPSIEGTIEYTTLPEMVRIWAGLGTDTAYFAEKKGQPIINNIIHQNDIQKWSFKQIANSIETVHFI